MQRHLFLYEKELLICKEHSSDSPVNGDAKEFHDYNETRGSTPMGGHVYVFKKSLKVRTPQY